MVKKIEEMDFYEILNLQVDATDQDVRNAYILAVATYHPDALASYGVLSAEETQEWHEGMAQAVAEGTYLIAAPFHCAVGTKPETVG